VRRQCQRPDCADVAAVAYSFDARRQLVVLDRLEQAVSPSGVLCSRHATAMVVPRGWWLDDRRIPVPTLFAPGVTNAPIPPERLVPERPATARAVRAPRVIPAGLPFESDDAPPAPDAAAEPAAPEAPETFALPEPSVVASSDPAPVPPQRRPAWMPSAENDQDEFGDVEVPMSPLLSRAFSGGNRRR
jgi:Protein of unknown function (DUF3499)